MGTLQMGNFLKSTTYNVLSKLFFKTKYYGIQEIKINATSGSFFIDEQYELRTGCETKNNWAGNEARD